MLDVCGIKQRASDITWYTLLYTIKYSLSHPVTTVTMMLCGHYNLRHLVVKIPHTLDWLHRPEYNIILMNQDIAAWHVVSGGNWFVAGKRKLATFVCCNLIIRPSFVFIHKARYSSPRSEVGWGEEVGGKERRKKAWHISRNFLCYSTRIWSRFWLVDEQSYAVTDALIGRRVTVQLSPIRRVTVQLSPVIIFWLICCDS